MIESIRMSRTQIRSNPILASELLSMMAAGRREQERRQLDYLLQQQKQGIPIHRRPDFIRVDGRSLELSHERIGVVGLVVDRKSQGYVTRLRAIPHSRWEVQDHLPFRRQHIERLLLRVLGEFANETALPELFAFRVLGTLEERQEGDSMDFAGLMAVIDAVNDHSNPLLARTAVVVSPNESGGIEPSFSTQRKLEAFVREFGNGSLLIRHADDERCGQFDQLFQTVWKLRSLNQLTTKLLEHKLLNSLLSSFPLDSRHAPLIADHLSSLLSDEGTYSDAESFLRRLKIRFGEQTPLKVKLEVLSAEEDLERHRGNCTKALNVRKERSSLEMNPLLTCYERRMESDNRLAASLYDFHRFDDVLSLLEPWLERIQQDPQVCLPETRSLFFNTLARTFVALNDLRWEELFRNSIELQKEVSQEYLDRTRNYLIHGLLKSGRLKEAEIELLGREEHQTAKESRFTDSSDPFRIWLHAKMDQQAGIKWSENKVAGLKIPVENHVSGFLYQALARQQVDSKDLCKLYFNRAMQCFSYGTDASWFNLKSIFSKMCQLAVAVLSDNQSQLNRTITELEALLSAPELNAILNWYRPEIERIKESRCLQSVNVLFEKVPHF